LSFKSWCQRARMACAIERLSMQTHVSVKQLASELGYASVPAFSHAFRQVTGKARRNFRGRNDSSYAGLSRVSILVHEKFCEGMDCRVIGERKRRRPSDGYARQ